MAPEQLDGKEADARADIFASGAVVCPQACACFMQLKRRMEMRLAIVSLCVLALAVVAVGQATHTDYMFESVNQFAGDPAAFTTHETEDWVFVKDLPIVGVFHRYQGSEETGTAYVKASGKISRDYSEGNFYGTVSLALDQRGMTCTGRFRGKRVDYVETLQWIVHCPDGSKIQERAEFVAASPTWTLYGTGRLLEPQGN